MDLPSRKIKQGELENPPKRPGTSDPGGVGQIGDLGLAFCVFHQTESNMAIDHPNVIYIYMYIRYEGYVISM